MKSNRKERRTLVIPVDVDGRTERVEVTHSLLPVIPGAGVTPSGLRTSTERVTASGLLIPERTALDADEARSVAPSATRPKHIARAVLRLVNRSGSGD